MTTLNKPTNSSHHSCVCVCVCVCVFVCKVAAVSWMLLLETELHCLLTQLSSVHNAVQCLWCVCVCVCVCVCLVALTSPSLFTLASPYPSFVNPPLTLKSRDVFLTRPPLQGGAHAVTKKSLPRTSGGSLFYSRAHQQSGWRRLTRGLEPKPFYLHPHHFIYCHNCSCK